MGEFAKMCCFVTAAAACLAAIELFSVFASAQSAPQQAAGAAIAAAMVVIPYVFTRAIEGLAPQPAAHAGAHRANP